MEIIRKLRQKKWKKDQILILFLAGVLLLVVALPVREPEEQEEGQGLQNAQISSSGDGDYAGYLEGRLEEVLSQMAGAGDVTAMVTLASSGEKVVEKDLEKGSETVTESDGQGGTRTTGSATSAQTRRLRRVRRAGAAALCEQGDGAGGGRSSDPGPGRGRSGGRTGDYPGGAGIIRDRHA